MVDVVRGVNGCACRVGGEERGELRLEDYELLRYLSRVHPIYKGWFALLLVLF